MDFFIQKFNLLSKLWAIGPNKARMPYIIYIDIRFSANFNEIYYLLIGRKDFRNWDVYLSILIFVQENVPNSAMESAYWLFGMFMMVYINECFTLASRDLLSFYRELIERFIIYQESFFASNLLANQLFRWEGEAGQV